MQIINEVDQVFDKLSVPPRDPLPIRQESDLGRNDGVSVESLFGDSIGMESSVDVLNDNEFPAFTDDCKGHAGEGKSHVGLGMTNRKFSTTERREFPPPIPSLARTENHQSRMPWILRRHYTGDGRLVLTEERNRRYEYFRAYRCDGRLTLHLVPLEVSDDDGVEEDEGGEEESDSDHDCDRGEEEEDSDRSMALWYGDVSMRSRARCTVKGLTVPAAITPIHS